MYMYKPYNFQSLNKAYEIRNNIDIEFDIKD